MEIEFSSRLFAVKADQVITVMGKTTPGAERFDIELASGSGFNDTDEVQFRLSVNFKRRTVERNSYSQEEGWGVRERIKNLIAPRIKNPVRRGHDFKISIYVGLVSFFVTIDEKPYCTFVHRKPFENIQQLRASKDIESIYQVDHIKARPIRLLENVAFRSTFPDELRDGCVIQINAVADGEKGSFTFNLEDSATGRNYFRLESHFYNKTMIVNDMNAENQ